MNFKNTALSEIQNFADEFPTYTAGQILLAIIHRTPEGKTTGEWLMKATDRELYTAVESAKLKERE